MPLWMLEQILCLPSVVFVPLSLAVFRVIPAAGSPMQVRVSKIRQKHAHSFSIYSSTPSYKDDLHERRSTLLTSTLKELIEVGVQHRVKMPACERILHHLDEAIKSGNGVPSLSPSMIHNSINVEFQSTRLLVSSLCAISGTVLGVYLLSIMLEVFLPREGL